MPRNLKNENVIDEMLSMCEELDRVYFMQRIKDIWLELNQ